MGVTTGHSGSFTYDGKYLIYGHEPGGGSAERYQVNSTILERTLFFIDPLTGETKGTMLQVRRRRRRAPNCTWHNFNVVPTKARDLPTVGIATTQVYPSSTSRTRWRRSEIAYADPGPAGEADTPSLPRPSSSAASNDVLGTTATSTSPTYTSAASSRGSSTLDG